VWSRIIFVLQKVNGGYMQKWEYKVIRGELSEDQLNTLGAEGWELIAVTGTSAGYFDVYTYLKRQISN
jgi:hypothetical protein